MHLLFVALKYVSLEYEFNARVICEESEAIFANLRRICQLLKTFHILRIKRTDCDMRVLMVTWLSGDGLGDGSRSLLRGTLALA